MKVCKHTNQVCYRKSGCPWKVTGMFFRHQHTGRLIRSARLCAQGGIPISRRGWEKIIQRWWEPDRDELIEKAVAEAEADGAIDT